MSEETPGPVPVLTWSASRKSIIRAMFEAQKVLGPAKLDKKNGHLNTKYASLESVLKAYQPYTDQGILLTQGASMEADELILQTTLTHVDSEEWVTSVLKVRTHVPESGPPKAGEDKKKARNLLHELGSAITYLRRYAIPPMTGIIAGEDNDGSFGKGKGQPERQQQPPQEVRATPDELERFRAKFNDLAARRFNNTRQADAWLKEQEPSLTSAYKRRLGQILHALAQLPETVAPPSDDDRLSPEKEQKRLFAVLKEKGLEYGEAVCWWAGQNCGWPVGDKGRPSVKSTEPHLVRLASRMLQDMEPDQVAMIFEDYRCWKEDNAKK